MQPSNIQDQELRDVESLLIKQREQEAEERRRRNVDADAARQAREKKAEDEQAGVITFQFLKAEYIRNLPDIHTAVLACIARS